MILSAFCGLTFSDWEESLLSASLLTEECTFWDGLPYELAGRLREARTKLSLLPKVISRELALEALRHHA